jgi:hypothetical protein
MSIETVEDPKNAAHHSRIRIGPESAFKQCQNRYRIGR